MDSDDKPKKGESMMGFFRRKEQFADLVLLSWSTSEFNLDQLIARQFGLDYYDKDAKQYLDWSFGKKIDYLKAKNTFTNEEYQILKEWKNFRNKLFHGDEPHYFIWDREKKNKFMDDAIKATHILRDAMFHT